MVLVAAYRAQDAAIIEACEAAVKGKGDGRVSVEDAQEAAAALRGDMTWQKRAIEIVLHLILLSVVSCCFLVPYGSLLFLDSGARP